MLFIYESLGQRIRTLRRLKNLTIEQLGERADLDSQYVGFIERGQGKPSLNALQRMAKALDAEVVELFRFQEMGRREERDYLVKQLGRLLEGRTAKEVQIIRQLVKQVVGLLPPQRGKTRHAK